MTANLSSNEERLLQLLADRATEGLDGSATMELSELLVSNAHYDTTYFEPAAAAIDLALSPKTDEAMPASLRDRLLVDAGRYLPTAPVQQSPSDSRRSSNRRISRAGWYLAAACLALAVLGWWRAMTPLEPSGTTVARQYQEFLNQTGDLVRLPWIGQEPGFKNVTGEVAWNDRTQRGFMKLVGMAPNDPTVSQYQLWIVDSDRDQHPVDGGVFDVSSSGEVIIPIDAKLTVDRPEVFAITLEQPGGVVVSDGPLLVIGAKSG